MLCLVVWLVRCLKGCFEGGRDCDFGRWIFMICGRVMLGRLHFSFFFLFFFCLVHIGGKTHDAVSSKLTLARKILTEEL